MGLSSLPAPSEGMLCIILVNTALTISIFKNFIRTVLSVFGLRFATSSWSLSAPPSSSAAESVTSHPVDLSNSFSCSTDTYLEQFRNLTPTVRFDSVCTLSKGDQDCSVCLNEFEPDSRINSLSCGHVFHNTCLEQWLDYCNITCPLCRKPLMPEEEAPCVW